MLSQLCALEELPNFPRLSYAEWHITDRCNLNCYYCNQSYLREGISAELPTELIVETLTEMVDMGLREVRLSGGGEPTLHPAFSSIVERMGAHGVSLQNLTTNGVLLNGPRIDALLSMPWEGVLFSMNAVVAADWSRVTGSREEGFDSVLGNISYLTKQKRSLKLQQPSVALSFGIDEWSYRKLITAYDVACDLAVDRIMFQTYNNLDYPNKVWRAGEEIVDQLFEIERRNAASEHPKEIVYVFPTLHLNEIMMNRLGGGSDGEGSVYVPAAGEHCFMPWHGATIRANGDVVLCCAAGHAYPVLGNIYKESIQSIWHGPMIADIRKRFKKQLEYEDTSHSHIPWLCRPGKEGGHSCPIKILWKEFVGHYE